MIRLVAIFLATLWAAAAFGQAAAPVLQPHDCKFFDAETAGADHASTDADAFGRAFDVTKYKSVSIQVIWASLTGSVDGTVTVQTSLNRTNWVDKAGATFTLSGANGSNLISMTNITEPYMRVVYAHVSIDGGTITGHCAAKG